MYKSMIIMAAMVVSMAACNSSKNTGPVSYGDNMLIERDGDEEYEITIIDPGFDSWFATYAKPANYYSLSYYEQKNAQYVSLWNERVGQQSYYRSANYPFENRIDYDPAKDYGLEVNYKLYYYFRYIQSIYGTRYHFYM